MCTSKKPQHTRGYGQKRIKIAMKVLEQIKNEFSETAEFIDDCLEQECSKENMTLEKVIFLFTCLKAKS